MRAVAGLIFSGLVSVVFRTVLRCVDSVNGFGLSLRDIYFSTVRWGRQWCPQLRSSNRACRRCGGTGTCVQVKMAVPKNSNFVGFYDMYGHLLCDASNCSVSSDPQNPQYFYILPSDGTPIYAYVYNTY